jgi:hypothetical protein
MENIEQLTADQRRAIVTKGLLSKPWLEEIKAQVAETFKVTHVNIEVETTQPISENEQQKECQSLENPQNPELDKIKTEFYEALKEFEGTDPTVRYQIPKQKCSRKLATIVTTINQEILPEYLTNNVTNFLELHNTIYAAAVATIRTLGARIERKKSNHLQNKAQTPPWERRLKTQIGDLRKDIGQVQRAQNGNTSNILQKHIRRIKKKYTYMLHTIQTMLTPRKYLTTSSKCCLQNHSGLGSTKKFWYTQYQLENMIEPSFIYG